MNLDELIEKLTELPISARSAHVEFEFIESTKREEIVIKYSYGIVCIEVWQ